MPEAQGAVQREYDAARETLAIAADLVAGERSAHYGHPLDNHERSARLMEAYLVSKGWTPPAPGMAPEDVCWLNVMQKIARDVNAPKPDGPIDVAGYAANVAEVRAERARRARPPGWTRLEDRREVTT